MRALKSQTQLFTRLLRPVLRPSITQSFIQSHHHLKSFSTAAEPAIDQSTHQETVTPVAETHSSTSADQPTSQSDAKPHTIIDLTAANIHEFLESGSPVLIDCWAPWCDPCRQLTPLLEQAVLARNGAVLLGKLNVDTESALIEAMQLPVESIPAIFIALGGEFIGSWTGLKPLTEINAIINKVLEVAQQRRFMAAKSADRSSTNQSNNQTATAHSTTTETVNQKPAEVSVEAPASLKASEMLAGAEQAFQSSDYERAASLYSTLFASASVSKEHRAMQARSAAGLIQSLVHEHTRTGDKQPLLRARSFVEAVEEACRSDRTLANQCKACAELDIARRAIALAEQLESALSDDQTRIEADAGAGDLDAMHKFVLLRFQGGQIDAAIDIALKLLKKDKTRGRELLLMILDRIGLESPLAVATRKRMAQIMF